MGTETGHYTVCGGHKKREYHIDRYEWCDPFCVQYSGELNRIKVKYKNIIIISKRGMYTVHWPRLLPMCYLNLICTKKCRVKYIIEVVGPLVNLSHYKTINHVESLFLLSFSTNLRDISLALLYVQIPFILIYIARFSVYAPSSVHPHTRAVQRH